jgi:hypothetical protein
VTEMNPHTNIEVNAVVSPDESTSQPGISTPAVQATVVKALRDHFACGEKVSVSMDSPDPLFVYPCGIEVRGPQSLGEAEREHLAVAASRALDVSAGLPASTPTDTHTGAPTGLGALEEDSGVVDAVGAATQADTVDGVAARAPRNPLADLVMGDFDSAMHGFFSSVDRHRLALNMSADEVSSVLARGYGDDIADQWDEWAGN